MYLSVSQHERTATDDLSLMIGISHHRTSHGDPSHDAEGATRKIPGSEIQDQYESRARAMGDPELWFV